MLAQGSQQYQCLKWVPDNSSLPSQLQFRQDFGVFPVMTVPGYFLFVLIRSCMLNAIMLFRDSKMHTSLYLVLFWMIHSFSGLHPNEIVPILHVCSCADLAASWSTQKIGVSPPCNRGSVRKCHCEEVMNEGTLLPGKCPRVSLPCLCGGQLEEHSPKLCMATGPCPCRHMVFHQGTSFLQSGPQWCFADISFRHSLALHKLTLVGFFLMPQPDDGAQR